MNELYANGRVRVPRRMGFTGDELARLDSALVALDAAEREDLPGAGPLLSISAARWAALMLYRSCQGFVFRDLDAGQIEDALGRRCPEAPSPSVCWSVDLAFRFLPDLFDLARGLAESDPLVERLRRLAAQWPLSSAGIRGIVPDDVSAFMEDGCLARLYVDRIIARADTGRLDSPRALEAVKAALGGHPEVAPALARALAQREAA